MPGLMRMRGVHSTEWCCGQSSYKKPRTAGLCPSQPDSREEFILLFFRFQTLNHALQQTHLVWWSWDIQHGFRESNMGPVWMQLPPKSFWGKEMDRNSLFSYLPKMIMRDKAGKRWGCFLEHLLGKRDTVTLLLPKNATRAQRGDLTSQNTVYCYPQGPCEVPR